MQVSFTAVDRESGIQRLRELQSIVDKADSGLEVAVQKLAALHVKAEKSQQLAASLQVLPLSLHLVVAERPSHLRTPGATLKPVLPVCQATVADLEQEQHQLHAALPLPKQRLDTLAASISGQSASLSKQLAQMAATQEVISRAQCIAAMIMSTTKLA